MPRSVAKGASGLNLDAEFAGFWLGAFEAKTRRFAKTQGRAGVRKGRAIVAES